MPRTASRSKSSRSDGLPRGRASESSPGRDDDVSSQELRSVAAQVSLREYLRLTAARWRFAYEAPRYELRAQNIQTVLGNVWLILNPLLLVLVYYLVFGVLVDINRGTENFLAFLTVGVFTFNWTQRSILQASTAISGNLGLIRSIRFPRALLPISTTVAQALAFLPVLCVMLVVVVAVGVVPSPFLLLLPALLATQVVFNLGAGFVVARLNTHLPDMENLLVFLFRLLFYVSGVLYSVDQYVSSEALRRLFLLNPFYVYVEAMRSIVVDGTPSVGVWSAAVAWAIVALGVGFPFFRAAELQYGRP